jgi:predicted dehydrogenase
MKKIWLVGTGNIAIEYAKVLKNLNVEYIAIGRGKTNVDKFIAATQHDAIEGGLENFLKLSPEIPSHAIVTVNVESLSLTATMLLKYGIKTILLEKPGVCNPSEIYDLVQLTREKNADVLLAYNRRFYASTLKAQEIIKEDGGVTSFVFEFTEWAHKITPMFNGSERFKYWFLGNSSHVVDLAFYLGGNPVEMSSFTSGSIEWHPNASVFSGAGKTDKGALFSYHANWKAPGRWFIEICTNKHRLYFKPLETLQIQNVGSVEVNPVNIEDNLDKEFKPGLYQQVSNFYKCNYLNFCTIDQQQQKINEFYLNICNYR